MSGISPVTPGGSTTTSSIGGARASSSTTGVDNNPLAALQGTMQQAAAHGSLSTPGDAAAVLATGGDFLANSAKSVASIDAGLQKKQAHLAQLKAGGGSQEQIAHEAQQIDLWSQLRDRISEAMDKVSKILQHKGDQDSSQAADWLDPRRQQGLPDTATHLASTSQVSAPAAGVQRTLRTYGA